MEFVTVEDDKSLVRDTLTGAILNTDKSAQNHYRQLKKQRENQQQRIDALESDVSEMKGLLHQILTKLG